MDIETNNPIVQKIFDKFMHQPSVAQTHNCGRVTLELMYDGSTFYCLDGKRVHAFHSSARAKSDLYISTQNSKRVSSSLSEKNGVFRLKVIYELKKLTLTQHFEVRDGEPVFSLSVSLSRTDGRNVETNYLSPLDFIYPTSECNPLFLSLDQKMFLVPYDNDMWVRYESTPLRPGRTSYDVTCIYDENSLNGLLIGALDFDTWKNAIQCASTDARVYSAFSGIADAGTHDCCPHGTLIGSSVSSSRFVCGWYDDIRDAMEFYGKRAMEDKFSFSWSHGVPFGWNSYSALAISITPEHWKETADFIYNELPNFRGGENTAYINLDAAFGLSEKKKAAIIEQCHARGQKLGTYSAPLGYMDLMSLLPLKGSFGKSRKNTAMRKENGEMYHKIDCSIPVDITRPEVEKDFRLSLREVVDKGYDYLKIDFTSHGSVEGKRYDKTVRTGRQALNRFYKIIAEELDPEKIGRDIFVSLSIAPLFPGGYGHARRCCCDAFGQHEDVRYVLNALNFGWWTNGTLYCYNDPDHTVLYNSMVDGRGPSDLGSARSRYNASVISGTVLLLSDNFGPTGNEELIKNSRERAKELANNPKINEVARFGKAFRPAYIKDGTCNIYYLEHEGRRFAAIFNFDAEKAAISVLPGKICAPESGTLSNLNSGETSAYNGLITVTLDAYDSAIFEIT